jgi:hypothetical protein
MRTGDCALYLRGCACGKMAGMKGVNKSELESMRLAEKLDWKGLSASSEYPKQLRK